MNRFMAVLSLLVFAGFPSLSLLGQDALSLGPLKWRSIGPNRGGRSLTSAGSEKRPLEYYFGAVGGGLWKTTDGGLTWAPVTDGKIASSSVGAVAVAPSNPDIVYAGMGESELRGNVMQGDGVYKSADGGKTWKNVGLRDSQAISRIRVDAKNPDLVYAAVLGHPYGRSPERGVYRSQDGGATWKQILYRSDRAGAEDLSIDPHDPRTMYASLWDVYRTPWSLSSGGPASGLFKSDDGGDHWTEITRSPGLPGGIDGKIGVAVSGADSRRVYAIVENQDGGVYRSDDAGATWNKINDERKVRQRAFYYTRIFADPKNPDVVYVLNTAFFKSSDGGKTFKAIAVPHGDNHDLWIASDNPQRMIESNDGGANVSTNGGRSWTGQVYPTAQLYHVATTADIPYQVCGAQQDNSTVCVPSDAGVNFRNPMGHAGDWLYSVGGGESGYIAPDPENPNIFYAGSQGALLTRYDRRTGAARDVQVYPLFFSGMSASSLKERWQWTFPIVFDPLDANTLYTSSQHLWKTTDKGESWTAVSPDLTRADPKTLGDSGGPITKDQNGPEIYGTIFTIAPSRVKEGTIWTGSDDGLAFLTQDAGKTWSKVTPEGLPEFSRISMIDASWHDSGTAYLAANHYQMDDRQPYIFKTHDYGKSWQKIIDGIPETDFVRVVREDPVRRGLLYAGTEHGIYVSFDDGGHWRSLRLNLPDTQVADLLVHGSDVVIATHGRSFYILDDIGLLREGLGKHSDEPVYLYTPGPMTKNVNEAIFDYQLAKPAAKVSIEILDRSGKVVQSFTGTPEEDKKAAAEQEESGGERRAPHQPPTRNAGLNRTSWNGRYAGPLKFPGMILWGANPDDGPAAVPGEYQVRITADGASQTKSFQVMADPREPGVSAADLEKQFDLALKVRDQVTQANTMVVHIRDIRRVLLEDEKKSGSPSLKAAADGLMAKLTTIEEDLYQVRNRSGQDPLNFPIKLNNQLAALDRSVMLGDGAPTAQAYTVSELLSRRLRDQQEAFDAALSSGMAQINPILTHAHLEPLH
ncbi:MAG TPA: hypothetical protein VGR96_04210 [Acidobacteriaceae bacterium]|nr:hypothetical protein [Acidobacteriaceae bacterium]